MALLSWLALEDELSPPALTIRAQSIPLNDTGRLRWDIFFPRVDTDSVVIRDITQLDLRRVSDRREWGTRGRLIDFEAPSIHEWEMVPIESYFQVGEREIQRLTERALGNDQVFRELVAASIPARVDALARANLRRIEVEAFEAWALGQITARNPHTGQSAVLDLGFDAARYQTAAVAWSGAANAYDELLAWLEDGADYVGGIQGVLARSSLVRLIQSEAPASLGLTMDRLSRADLESELSDQLGRAFQFVTFDDTVEPYTDGGIATSAVNLWPADVIAAIPANDGGRVGSTYFAPVARAYEIARAAPDAGIDVRGQTVYSEVAGNGRQLTEECQVNALTIPNEQRLWVLDVTP